MLLVVWTGAHWTLLQTIAWSGMLVNYAAQDGLTAGIVKTFDGKNPCQLCVIVEDGRTAADDSSEQRLHVQPKLDWIFQESSALMFSRQSVRVNLVLREFAGDHFGESPPKPPPRSFLHCA